jgi:hypothetical protein
MVLSISRALEHIASESLLFIEFFSNPSPAQADLNNKCPAAQGFAFKQRLDKHLSVETQTDVAILPSRANDTQAK